MSQHMRENSIIADDNSIKADDNSIRADGVSAAVRL
jgi:hypothetical protein